MPTTVPCLWFDGQAEQAAELYTAEGSALTVDSTLGGQRFVALDGGPQYRSTKAVSFQVPCADQDDIDRYTLGPGELDITELRRAADGARLRAPGGTGSRAVPRP